MNVSHTFDPAPDGGLLIKPDQPDLARQMTLARKIMREDWDTLQVLAKSAHGAD